MDGGENENSGVPEAALGKKCLGHVPDPDNISLLTNLATERFRYESDKCTCLA